jgi:hypothetical protein
MSYRYVNGELVCRTWWQDLTLTDEGVPVDRREVDSPDVTVYQHIYRRSIHQMYHQDLAELALADEGVVVDRQEVDSPDVSARPSGASSRRRGCVGRSAKGYFAEYADKT